MVTVRLGGQGDVGGVSVQEADVERVFAFGAFPEFAAFGGGNEFTLQAEAHGVYYVELDFLEGQEFEQVGGEFFAEFARDNFGVF